MYRLVSMSRKSIAHLRALIFRIIQAENVFKAFKQGMAKL
jgi:hypothetical protein